jgi:hypothetical protein
MRLALASFGFTPLIGSCFPLEPEFLINQKEEKEREGRSWIPQWIRKLFNCWHAIIGCR